MAKLVKKSYMQLGITARKSDVVADANAFLCFPILPLPSCFKNLSMPHPPRVLEENSKYPRVRGERK